MPNPFVKFYQNHSAILELSHPTSRQSWRQIFSAVTSLSCDWIFNDYLIPHLLQKIQIKDEVGPLLIVPV